MCSSPEKEWEETPDLPLDAHSDRRLKRLQNREFDDHRIERHRHIHEPEIIGTEDEEISRLETAEDDDEVTLMKNARRWESSEEEDEAEDLDEDDIEHRRMVARQKAVIKAQEEVSKKKNQNNLHSFIFSSFFQIGTIGKRGRERK